ncbi:MAG TPA: PAS domain S-box protein [Firmicutes bacterium]|nr:PAS domain S-box protein [Bacillota bacterium]
MFTDSCYYKKLNHAYRQLGNLQEQAGHMPEQFRSIFLSALDEFSNSLREVKFLLDELRYRNIELAASNAALEGERQRYLELFEFAPDGYLVTDRDGRIMEANNAAKELLKAEHQLIIGKPLSIFIAPEEKETFTRIFKKLQEGSVQKIADRRIYLQPWAGKPPFPASFTAGVVRDISGKPGSLRWRFSDISWRKKAEDEMQKADKLETIGLLAGGIAHDFNNLLANLLGHISLARFNLDNPEKLAQRLDLSEKVVFKAKDILRQLFQLSQKDVSDYRIFSIKNIIDNVLELSLKNPRVKSHCTFPRNLLHVKADEAQIGQVIQNIIINALQSMPEGGDLWISAKNITHEEIDRGFFPSSGERNYLCLTVSDTGCGIPKEVMAKIFDPFFTTKKEGTGLGLATSYFIIKKNGGHIAVDSKAGHGTTFHLYLPAREPRGNSA